MSVAPPGGPDDGDEDRVTSALKQRQVNRLAALAKDFDRAVDELPDGRGAEYKKEQQEIADKRRHAQISEWLLRLRVFAFADRLREAGAGVRVETRSSPATDSEGKHG